MSAQTRKIDGDLLAVSTGRRIPIFLIDRRLARRTTNKLLEPAVPAWWNANLVTVKAREIDLLGIDANGTEN